ncbi:FecR family protein [bacterium]|nr:FecR family protein [bacterium]
MRKAAVLLICSFATLVFVGASLLESVLVLQRVAAVSDPGGSISVQPAGSPGFVPLGTTERVKAGDVLRTGADGHLTLNWVDDSRLRIGPDTTVQVLKCQVNRSDDSQDYLFKLDSGQVWVRVLKALSQQSKFEIRTPTATAAVRGTVFSVAVTPDGATRVSVLKGSVALSDKQGSVDIGAGEAGAAGAVSHQVAEMKPDEVAQWDRELSVAKPSLELIEPTYETLPVGLTAVPVSGKAERGSTVTVNGVTITPNLLGKFAIQVPVPAGSDRVDITVRAVDAKGFESVQKRTLVR